MTTPGRNAFETASSSKWFVNTGTWYHNSISSSGRSSTLWPKLTWIESRKEMSQPPGDSIHVSVICLCVMTMCDLSMCDHSMLSMCDVVMFMSQVLGSAKSWNSSTWSWRGPAGVVSVATWIKVVDRCPEGHFSTASGYLCNAFVRGIG